MQTLRSNRISKEATLSAALDMGSTDNSKASHKGSTINDMGGRGRRKYWKQINFFLAEAS